MIVPEISFTSFVVQEENDIMQRHKVHPKKIFFITPYFFIAIVIIELYNAKE